LPLPAIRWTPAWAALTQVMAEEHGYGGDRQHYDDLQNANLIRVIDRRRGLPVALGILYLHAARAQGWRAAASISLAISDRRRT